MMAVLRRTLGPVAGFALLMGVTACETAKSANPLSPTIAGPIAGVTITPPKGLEPAANQQIRDKDQPFNVAIENAISTSPRPYKMRMQIASDSNFASVVWSRDGIDPAEGGQTKFRMPDRLQPGRQYFWRVMADDGANQSAWSEVVGFQVLMPAAFGAPSPRSPVGNQQLATTRPELRVGNGSAQGPVAQPFYQFQVASDSGFGNIVVNEETPQQSGETVLTVPGTLGYGTTYYWRARISDGDTIGPWSSTETFRTAAPPAPGPSPGPSPGPAPGGSCVLSTPEAIVSCNRSRYGYMDETQILQFLRQVARDLNTVPIAGGPWGLLVKTGGHNCHGYSCDIICAGNGSSQRQYDVLGDVNATQYPTWSGPLPTIVIRPCEVQ
jgi:hypothetical protein